MVATLDNGPGAVDFTVRQAVDHGTRMLNLIA